MDPVTTYTSCRLRDSAGAIAPYAAAWWRGAPALWRVAILNPDGSLNDLSGLAGVSLTLTEMVNGGPGRTGWLQRDYGPSFLHPELTAEQWENRTGWHFEAALEGEDTLLPVSGTGSDYWAILEGRTTAGELIPLAALQITLRSTRGDTFDRDPLALPASLLRNGFPVIHGGRFITFG